MAKKVYIGVSGKARKVKKIYIGVGGVARKAKSAYVGVGGVARQTFAGADPVFSKNTWEQIVSACHSGAVPSTWKVGDQKSMVINGTTYNIDIIGKGHDTYTAGGKAPLTFQLHEIYNTKKPMNSSDINAGGWNSCAMRKTHLPAILALMPAEVQSGIREVDKLASAGSSSATIQTASDKLFLLSEIEVTGKTSYSVPGEGTQYAYYSAGNSAIKALSGTNTRWWLRSPYKNKNDRFCYYHENGSVLGYGSSNAYGVAFAFCF